MAQAAADLTFGDSDLWEDFGASEEETEGVAVDGDAAEESWSSSEAECRRLPNILVTGTPGVGKTAFCEAVAEACSVLSHVAVNDLVTAHSLVVGADAQRGGCLIVDESRLVEHCGAQLRAGGCLLDTHLCDCWPRPLLDLVVVLRCDNTTLYDRLQARGYAQRKVSENVEAEIMQVILDEANAAFANVVELRSETIEQMEDNVQTCVEWLRSWKPRADDKTDAVAAFLEDVDGDADDAQGEERGGFVWDPEIASAFVDALDGDGADAKMDDSTNVAFQ